MTYYTGKIGKGLRVGDFVRVLARGMWRNETGVVTRILGGTLATVLFSNESESSFRLGEVEFVEREVR